MKSSETDALVNPPHSSIIKFHSHVIRYSCNVYFHTLETFGCCIVNTVLHSLWWAGKKLFNFGLVFFYFDVKYILTRYFVQLESSGFWCSTITLPVPSIPWVTIDHIWSAFIVWGIYTWCKGLMLAISLEWIILNIGYNMLCGIWRKHAIYCPSPQCYLGAYFRASFTENIKHCSQISFITIWVYVTFHVFLFKQQDVTIAWHGNVSGDRLWRHHRNVKQNKAGRHFECVWPFCHRSLMLYFKLYDWKSLENLIVLDASQLGSWLK